MSTKKIITWVAIIVSLLALLVVLMGGLLWYSRLRVQERPAADASYGLINSPSNGAIVFAGDPVYVDSSFMLTYSNPADLALYVDGAKYVLDGPVRPYANQEPVKCPSADPAFCGLLEVHTLWFPTGPGPHVLSACMSGNQSQAAEWTVCSEAVKVIVTDLSAAPQTAGQYLPQAGDTLETVAQKFGLPALLVAADNPGVEPVVALPVDTPINIPADPAAAEPAGGKSTTSSSTLDTAVMTVDLPVDKVYCYASLGGNFWTRMPAGSQSFAYPLDGHLDLSAEFRTLALPPAGGTLALDCWGWSGPALVYLGRGQTGFGALDGTELQVRGDHFALTAVLHPSGLPHAMGGTPPPATPAPAILPPFGLASTNTLAVCIDHHPLIMRGFLGPLFCKAAIEYSQRILVWEWGAIFPPAGYSDKIDGYKVYKTDSSGKLVLIATIPDPEQKIFINTAASTLAEVGVPTYCVTAYLGPVESTSSCYKLSGEPAGLAMVTIVPVPFSESELSYFSDWTQKVVDDCDIDEMRGTGSEGEFGLASDEIVVGFDHSVYDCVQLNDIYWRASLLFNLDAIKGPVSSAVLKYKQGKTISGGADGYGTDGQSCAAALNISTEVSTAGISAFDPYRALPATGYSGFVHSVDVTEAIRDWMLGAPNDGFLFTGRDEGFPEENYACWSRYRDFALTVTYFK